MIRPSIETAALQFTANTIRNELRHEEARFDRLDTLYSKFFFIQNDYVRFLYRIGDIPKEERARRWAEIDLQEAEWESRLSDWREKRFNLRAVLSEIEARLRELQKQREANCVAA